MDARIRRDLRPGDLGAIAALHGRVYAAEHGLDATFEASVAISIAQQVERGFPRPHEGLWVVEVADGRVCGSIGLTDEGGGCGRIRWVVLDPVLRGAGLGRRLIGGAVEHARQHGYRRLELVTFSALRTAGRLYRDAGFERVAARRTPIWGRTIVIEDYALELPAPTQATETVRAR